MAQGTPVVAIAELGTASILIEGQGAMIAAENESEFAQKVHHLLTSHLLRKELGECARAYAHSKWSAATQTERMLKFYDALINKAESADNNSVKLSIQQS